MDDQYSQAKVGPAKPPAGSPAPASAVPVAPAPDPPPPVQAAPAPAPAVPPPAEELPSPVEEIIPGAPAQQVSGGTQEKKEQISSSAPNKVVPPPTTAASVAPAPSVPPTAPPSALFTPSQVEGSKVEEAPPVSELGAGSAPAPPKSSVPGPVFGASAMIKRSSPKIFKILFVLLVLIVIGIAVYFFFFYRVTLKIAPATTGAKITLDGKETKGGVYRVMPGIHSISIEKDGYISYEVKQNFSPSQKLSFTASLKEALPPELVASGAKLASLASSAQALNFVSSDGHLAFALADPQNQGKFATENLSNGSYEGIRKLLFSDDDKFVLILDTKALRVLDFAKTDLINQVEADLPPSASLISSVSWNSGKSTYFPEPNSRIIYDLKTSEGWNLVSATRSHDKSDLVMQIDAQKFKNLVIDWRESPKDILLVGGPVCTFDIVNRTDCKIVSAEGKSDYVWGEWGKKAKYAIAVDASGELWVLKNGRLEDAKVTTRQGLVSWIDESSAYIVTSSRPIRVNFDTGEIINYADIKGLSDATSFGVLGTNVFFTDTEGLQKASLAENPYNR